MDKWPHVNSKAEAHEMGIGIKSKRTYMLKTYLSIAKQLLQWIKEIRSGKSGCVVVQTYLGVLTDHKNSTTNLVVASCKNWIKRFRSIKDKSQFIQLN